MNSRQLKYAIMLAEIRNFSHVAESLNITQPALSKQILSLEKELGVALFDRKSTPVALTPAGMHFIREAQELLYKEDQLLRSMEQYQSGDAGQLTIGITPFRSSYLIPEIVKSVRAKFPGIQVKLHEAGSDILRKEAAEGKYDFAVVNLPVDDASLDVIPLETDCLALVIPTAFSVQMQLPKNTDELEFSTCKDLPFAVVGESQEMRRLFDKLCITSGFTPNIAVEVVGLTTAWSMACAGVAATILPLQFVSEWCRDNNLLVYKIKGAVYERQPVVVVKKGQYVSKAAQYAIGLLGRK